jgi:hypothetical protein
MNAQNTIIKKAEARDRLLIDKDLEQIKRIK